MPRAIELKELPGRKLVIYDELSKKDKLFANGWNACIDYLLENVRTIDAVEVVRCKDCKHFMFGDYCMHDGAMEHSHARENDFCSYGERRESNGQNPTG